MGVSDLYLVFLDLVIYNYQLLAKGKHCSGGISLFVFVVVIRIYVLRSGRGGGNNCNLGGSSR